MSRQVTPPRTIKSMVEKLRDDRAAQGVDRHITYEQVEAALPNGQFQVLGTQLGTTGVGRNVSVGKNVPIAWKDGKPLVIVDHHAQEAQGIRILPGGGGVIEELFIAVNPATGLFDVYFRNISQVTPLGLSSILLQPGPGNSNQNTVQWGLGGDRFLIYQSSFLASQPIYTIKLNRQPNKVMAGTASARVEATTTLNNVAGPALTATYSPSADAAFTVANDGATNPSNILLPALALSFAIGWGTSNSTTQYLAETGFVSGDSWARPPLFWTSTPTSILTRVPLPTLEQLTFTAGSVPTSVLLDENGHLIVSYTITVKQPNGGSNGSPVVVNGVNNTINDYISATLTAGWVGDVTVKQVIVSPTLTGALPNIFASSVVGNPTNFPGYSSGNIWTDTRTLLDRRKSGALQQREIQKKMNGDGTLPTLLDQVLDQTFKTTTILINDPNPVSHSIAMLQTSRRHILYASLNTNSFITSIFIVPLVTNVAALVGTDFTQFQNGNGFIIIDLLLRDQLFFTPADPTSGLPLPNGDPTRGFFTILGWNVGSPQTILLNESTPGFPPRLNALKQFDGLKKLSTALAANYLNDLAGVKHRSLQFINDQTVIGGQFVPGVN